jgi:PAS domain S-box-containing protein
MPSAETAHLGDETLREFQQKLKALHEVNLELSNAATLEEVYRRVVELGRDRLGFDRLGLFLVDEHAQLMQGTFGTDTDGQVRDERAFRRPIAEDNAVSEVIRDKLRTRVWHDVPLWDMGVMLGIGWNAMAAIWDGDKAIGWLATDNFIRREPFQPYLEELLLLYGSAIGHAIRRKRVEAVRRDSEEQLRLALDAAQMGTWHWEIETNRVMWSDRTVEIFGLCPGEFDGRYETYLSLVHPVDRTRLAQTIDDALAGRGPDYSVEHRIVWPDGSVRWLEGKGRVYRDDRGQPQRMAGIVTDITTRKQAVASLRQFVARMETLHEIDRAILAAESPADIAVAALARMQNLMPFKRAGVSLFDLQTGQGRLLAVKREEESALPDVGESWPLGDYGDWAAQLSGGEIFYVLDLADPPFPAEAFERLHAEGMRSMLSAPMLFGSELIGAISVASDRAAAFSAEHIDIAREMADDLAIAVYQAQLFEQAQQRAQQLSLLNEVGRAVSTLRNLDDLLEIIYQQVQRTLPLDAFMVVLYDSVTEMLTFPLVYDSGQRWPEEAGPLAPGTAFEQVVRSAAPLLINRTPEEIGASVASSLLGNRARRSASLMFAPLLSGSQLLGLLSAQSYTLNAYTAEHLAVLSGVAHQAAIAIENARLFENVHRQVLELRTLHAVALAATEAQSEEELLSRVMAVIDGTLRADRFRLLLLDARLKGLLLHPLSRPTGQEFQVVGLGVGLEGRTAQDGQPRRVAGTRQNANVHDLHADTLSEVCVPIKLSERVLGVIHLESRQPAAFDADDEQLLITLAGQLATALERLRGETRREALIQELETKNAELERFTYTVSHDLKSPLITIRGFLGFLDRDAREGNLERFAADMQRIVDATNKMQRLLDELLELSRIGRLINPPEIVPFAALAQEAADLAAGRIAERGVMLTIAPTFPSIYGDRTRLLEVLQNLIDNAVKFMGNQPHPHIEIGIRTDPPNQPVFFVRDNGIGIDPLYRDKVFGLFDKLDAQSEGTGVGLALVKRIVEVHGGRIWVESEGAGSGTTFCFTLTTLRN